MAKAYRVLSFRVIADDGRPLVGSRVFVESYANKRREFRRSDSDVDGCITVDEAQIVANRFWVEADDRMRVRVERSSFGDWPEVEEGILVLFDGPRVIGRVVGLDGQLDDRAKVTLRLAYSVHPGSAGSNGPDIVVALDQSGNFRTPPLPPGMIKITAHAPGHAPHSKWLNLVASDDETSDLGMITLERAFAIEGRVEDEAGRGIEGADLYIFSSCDKGVRTSAAGRFRLDGLAAGSHRIEIGASGFKEATIETSTDVQDLVIRLTRAQEIRGTIIDADTSDPVPIDDLRLCKLLSGRAGLPIAVG